MSERVVVRFVITIDDVVDASRMMTARSRYRWLTPVVGFGAIAGGVSAIVVGNPVTATVLIAIGILVLVAGRLRSFDRWLLSRQFKPILGVESEIIAEERGIAYNQAGVSALHTWAALERFHEDERAIIVTGRNNAQIGVPKRAFASGDELQRFRDIVLRGLAGELREDGVGR